MPYSKTGWVNLSTPLNATNLNKIEQGISDSEPHRGTTAPTSPVTGKLWEDTNTLPATLKAWDGSTWEVIGGAVQSEVDNYAALPSTATAGAIYYVKGGTTAGDGGEGFFQYIAAPSFTANASTNVITSTGHPFYDRRGVRFYGTSLPGGLVEGVTYYVVSRATNTFQVSTTRGGTAVDLTSTGSGTLSVAMASNGGTVLGSSASGWWFRLDTGPLNVRWFGAVADGTTDDYDAVQAAIYESTIVDRSRAVYMPEGIYLITKSVDCPGQYYTHSGTYNLHLFGDGTKTEIHPDLTEAYPLFDVSNNSDCVIEDINIWDRGTSQATCHFLFSSTVATGSNRWSLVRVKCLAQQASAPNFKACLIAVSADQGNLQGSEFTSRLNGARGAVISQNNITSVASKYHAVTVFTADTTALTLANTNFVGYNTEALYIENFKHTRFQEIYTTAEGTTVTSIVTLDATVNMSVSGSIRSEDQSTGGGVRVFNCTGTSTIHLDLTGHLGTDAPNGIVFGGSAFIQGKFSGSTVGDTYYFENSGTKAPYFQIFERDAHQSGKVFLNTTNLTGGGTGTVRLTLDALDPQDGNLNTVLANYAGLSGSRFNGQPWRSPAEVIYFPGGGSTWKGHMTAVVNAATPTTTTTGVLQGSFTTFTTYTVPLTALNAAQLLQKGTTPSPWGEWLILVQNNITSTNTANLRLQIGATTLFTLNGIAAPAATLNVIEILVRFMGGSKAHVKVTNGATIAVNTYPNAVAFTADVSGTLAQSSTNQIDPFTTLKTSFRYGI